MLSTEEAVSFLNSLFEEEALILGGLVATQEMDDDLVWSLVRNLDVVRTRALRRLREKTEDLEKDGVRPHPAIQEFLFRLARQEGQPR